MKELFDDLISDKKYMKLKEGDNKFRIVIDPIVGWIDWKDKKPYRYRKNNKPTESFDPERPIKPFIAAYVWDYERNDLFILEITQTTILKAMKSLVESEEWGDFKGYDLKIKRSGAGPLTKYLLEPVPPKTLSKQVLERLATSPVNLEALYDGKDPWGTRVSTGDSYSFEDEVQTSTMNPLEELKEHLSIDGIPADRLEEWLKIRAQTKNHTVEHTIKLCLEKQVLPSFKKAFAKFISPQELKTLAV